MLEFDAGTVDTVRDDPPMVEGQPQVTRQNLIGRPPSGIDRIRPGDRFRQSRRYRQVAHRHHPAARIPAGGAVHAQLLQTQGVNVQIGLFRKLPVSRGDDLLIEVSEETARQCQGTLVRLDAAFDKEYLKARFAQCQDHQVDGEHHDGRYPMVIIHKARLASCPTDIKAYLSD